MRGTYRLLLCAAPPSYDPRNLFAAGEQGFWYDPSDFSTMFQDSAGTTPVTAIEQPVGRILDKSGRGNTATQSTTTSRPILRNLYNQIQYTEQFDNANWSKTTGNGAVVTVVANQTTSPDGTTSADLLAETTVNDYHNIVSAASVRFSVTAGVAYTMSIYAKKGPGATAPDIIQLTHHTSYFGAGQYANFNISTVAVTAESGSTPGYPATITSVGDGWVRVTFTATCTTSNTIGGVGQCLFANNNPTAGRLPPYVGSTTSNLYIWGASYVPAIESSIPYQRVVTNTLGSGVYDTDLTKFKPYLAFDGTDDWLQTANIDFSATDKMSVFAGVRKLSDAATGLIVELSTTTASNDGAFGVFAPSGNGGNSYLFTARGTAQATAGTGVFAPAPDTAVITGLADLSGPKTILRRNSIVAESLATTLGAVNFGTYPLYIGRRGGTTLPFNGRIYYLIARGALTKSPQLEITEQWVNQRTGAY